MSDGVYYELSWAILSTIGLALTALGFMVCGIVNFTTISLVPVIVSSACAIANGLCYYAFYTDYPTLNRQIAAGFGDVAWLIQEAGLSFYSYLILRTILRNKEKTIFLGLFWLFISALVAVRIVILVHRSMDLGRGTNYLQHRIDHMHVVYFTLIATTECICAFFLLRKFTEAKNSSIVLPGSKPSLFKMLTRSAEIRLATLAPIGICRAVTYSFQTSTQRATNTVSQVDRFAYTLECMFPVVMMIDLLATRLTNQSQNFRTRMHGGAAMSPTMEMPPLPELAMRKSAGQESFVRLGHARTHSHRVNEFV